jgi:RNA-binding protein NOB1
MQRATGGGAVVVPCILHAIPQQQDFGEAVLSPCESLEGVSNPLTRTKLCCSSAGPSVVWTFTVMPGAEKTPEEGATKPAPASKRVLVLDTAALIAATDSLFVLGGLIEADGTAVASRAAGEQVDFVLVPEVAQEVKDPRARARLALLSESATVRHPSAQAMDAVIRFAKATGDFSALSRVDLKVLGLAWMLETELNGLEHLREAPAEPRFAPTRTMSMLEAIELDDQRKREEEEMRERQLVETEGWVPVVVNKNPGRSREQRELPIKLSKPKKLRKRGKKKKKPSMGGSEDDRSNADVGADGDNVELSHDESAVAILLSQEGELREAAKALSPDSISPEDGGISNQPAVDAFSTSLNAALERLDVKTQEGDDAEMSDDDDGVGWINSENLDEQMARDSGGQDAQSDAHTRVGCVTTDFAMQNVLLQMGINLVSVDGRRVIRRVRRYVLRCQSCTEVTRELERLFCGRCGNATLTRVTFDVDKNGVARIFLSSKFKPRLRGTKYPIPMPRGGRNNKDLILCEDQIDPAKLRRAAKQRERKAVDVLDPDSFYKFGTKHVQHRPLVVGYGSRNPNEGKPSTKVSRR